MGVYVETPRLARPATTAGGSCDGSSGGGVDSAATVQKAATSRRVIKG